MPLGSCWCQGGGAGQGKALPGGVRHRPAGLGLRCWLLPRSRPASPWGLQGKFALLCPGSRARHLATEGPNSAAEMVLTF